ncbi:MAG: hypothetical protein IJS29_01450 [Selenomonadaceae bacterium]|nr:hypothetical protein [Selenomonadaceae bacterium]
MLEQQSFKVKRMYIQALCRDYNLRIAKEHGITQAVYIIQINKISDHWLKRYFKHKAKLLREALEKKYCCWYVQCVNVGTIENALTIARHEKIVRMLKN